MCVHLIKYFKMYSCVLYFMTYATSYNQSDSVFMECIHVREVPGKEINLL